MIERFRQLAPREQAVVAAGAVLALLIVGWFLVWSPLSRGTAELDQAVVEKSRLVIDLRRASGLAGGATGSSTPASGQTMMLLVDQTARPIGLANTFVRTQQQGADAYSISFQNAPFHTLVEWLAELKQSHGVSVTSADISSTREPGLVSGLIFLDRT